MFFLKIAFDNVFCDVAIKKRHLYATDTMKYKVIRSKISSTVVVPFLDEVGFCKHWHSVCWGSCNFLKHPSWQFLCSVLQSALPERWFRTRHFTLELILCHRLSALNWRNSHLHIVKVHLQNFVVHDFASYVRPNWPRQRDRPGRYVAFFLIIFSIPTNAIRQSNSRPGIILLLKYAIVLTSACTSSQLTAAFMTFIVR